MLPYFAAATHHLHAKSAHIHLQIMQKLSNKNKKGGLQTIYKIIQKTSTRPLHNQSEWFWGGSSGNLEL